LSSPNPVHFARGASYFILQTVVTSAAMVVSFAILARLVTTYDMGILAVLTLVNGLCQVILGPALSQAATKFIAESVERGDIRSASSVFYQTIRTTLLVAAILALVVFLGARELSIWFLGGENRSIFFQILAADTVLYAGALPALTGSLLGLQKFKEQATVGVASTLIRQAFIILLVIFLRSFVGLVIAWVIGDSIATAMYLIYVVKALGWPRFEFPLRRLVSYSWPLSASSAVSFASTWFDRALLLVFLPLATLGVYNAMITAFGVVVGISGVISNTLFAAYSSMQSTEQKPILGRAVYLASRYLSFVAVPLALGLLATSKLALALFVGQAYVGGSVPLMILCGVFTLTLVGNALSPVFLARGETLVSGAITMSSVVMSLFAAFLLVPISGMLGASIARGSGMILSTVLTIVILRRRIRLQLDLHAIVKSLIAGGIMASIVTIIQIPMYSRFLIPAYALVGAVTYLIMLRLLRAIGNEDIDLIRKYFGARLAFAANIVTSILLPK
jgi:O-antigen/teichoic acid export membrane protein